MTEISEVQVIATTISGSIKDWGKVEKIVPLFREHGRSDVTLQTVDSHREARERTRELVADGCRQVISAGGSGTFKVHAFLMAMIQVPMTVMSGVVALLALIPVVNVLAGLAGFGLSIYSIILTVRMVKVVHGLGTGRAVAAIIIPPVVLSLIGGCLIMTIGSSLLASLMQIQ